MTDAAGSVTVLVCLRFVAVLVVAAFSLVVSFHASFC